MIDAATAAAELEEDQRIRQDELAFLENLCGNLNVAEQDRMRRSMLLMLYAHFEGFAKIAFTIYCRHINEAKVCCKDVQPELGTTALRDVFKAFRNPDSAGNFLPEELRNMDDLRSLAVERTLVKDAFTLGHRAVTIPDKYVDTESNLKPIVLRKNLYRLGLRHDMFEAHEPTVGQLLGRRNNIAHGAEVIGIDAFTYNAMRTAVYSVMDDLRLKITNAIATRAYLRIAREFRYMAPQANSVALAGEFNNWKPAVMIKDAAGIWSAVVSLAPGTYAYKFVVDGTNWAFDQDNPKRMMSGSIENSAAEVT